MREIALHILDVAENAIAAGAGCIRITVDEARVENLLTIIIDDNGEGVQTDRIGTLTDPFVTSRTNRKVGLGLPLLEAATRRCEGNLTIDTHPGKGSRITAIFRYDHLDRAPIGDMASTLITLIMGNTEADLVYSHRIGDNNFDLDTREIKEVLGPLYGADPVVMRRLKQTMDAQLKQIGLRA